MDREGNVVSEASQSQTQAQAQTQTRRALIRGAVSGAAAIAVGTFLRPSVAEGATGDAVKAGKTTAASASTVVTTTSGHGLRGISTATSGNMFGVRGDSSSSSGIGVSGYNAAGAGTPVGVKGVSNGRGIGVYGVAGRGVIGEASAATGVGVVAKATSTTGTPSALRALSVAPDAIGVYAENSSLTTGGGAALQARSSSGFAALIQQVSGDPASLALQVTSDGNGVTVSTPNTGGSPTTTGIRTDTPSGTGLDATGAVGVHGTTTGGSPAARYGVWGQAMAAGNTAGVFENSAPKSIALDVDGGMRVRRAAGLATVLAGQTSVVVQVDLDLTPTSIVLATPQVNGAVPSVSAIVSGPSQITLRLAATVGGDVPVAWLALVIA
jgi:hypothetical protein